MKQYTGKTVDEVLNNIALENKCQIADITYNVIEEKKGLLGIGSTVVVEASTPQDIKDFIFDYLGEYFTELNQGVAIEIIVEKQKEDNSNLFKVILDAENNAIIIGKNGQTLRAISTVLKAAVNSTFKKRVNIIIDVNHYKEDRYKKVKAIAHRVAREVLKSHIDAELDPMPNDERKVIHQYLQDMKGVTTTSIGEGPKRHLVIKYVASEEEKEETKEA
ncbi:MAG: R3H domain-containing nucleic acid-binding protein [Erysipelotrichaceae bacterium]|nr:R3H domain-containing nucleic acid-binding protein [Erysipelotrichaceae bacterium]